MPAARRRRPYASPLRAEQTDRTRQKLLEAAIDLVVEGGGEELTVRQVAARAGVSVPTAYRYFPDRETLHGELAVAVSSRIIGVALPDRADGLSGWVRSIYAGFAANDRIVRAQLNTPAGRALRAFQQQGRNAQILDMVARAFPRASAATQRRFAALLRTLANLHAWVALHDDWGMTGVEAGEIIAWAITAWVAELQRRPAALDFDLSTAAPARPRARVTDR
jgi:AcrR family transcriptional regulator